MIRRDKKQNSANKLTAITTLILFLGIYFFYVPYFYDNMPKSEDRKPVPPAEPAKEAAVNTSSSSEYLVLVNKTHGLGESYEPKDLQKVASAAGADNGKHLKLRKAAALALNDLTEAAANQGHTIKLTSGYRDYAYQKELYEKYYGQDGKTAEQYSAKAGYSEHQSGLCADVSSPSVEYTLTEAYGSTKEGIWLAENAHKYGYIIRYPEGKEKLTGYQYEPWHIRYVGIEAAAEIYKKGIVLEEYLGNTT